METRIILGKTWEDVVEQAVADPAVEPVTAEDFFMTLTTKQASRLAEWVTTITHHAGLMKEELGRSYNRELGNVKRAAREAGKRFLELDGEKYTMAKDVPTALREKVVKIFGTVSRGGVFIMVAPGKYGNDLKKELDGRRGERAYIVING